MMFSKSVDETEKKKFELTFCGPNICWFPNITRKNTHKHICYDFQFPYVENHYFGHTQGIIYLLDFSGGCFLVHIGTIKNINLFGHSSQFRFCFWRFSILTTHQPSIIVFIAHACQKAGVKYRFSVLLSRVDVRFSFHVVVLLHALWL